MKQARLKHGVRNQNQPTSLPIINIACKQSANGWYYENFQIKCTKGRRARAHWNLKDALSRLLILMIFWVYFLWILGVSWHHVLIYLYLTTTDSTGENCYHGVTSSPSQRLSIRWEYKRLTKTSLNPENWSILDHVTLNFDLKGAPSHFRPFFIPFSETGFFRHASVSSTNPCKLVGKLVGPLVTLSDFQSLVALSEKWKVKSIKRIFQKCIYLTHCG